ncbi:MAG: Wzz/FepE/Etk N-terminal domain-containing protein [Pseudomonadota bacterium]|uniref:GumC family protein n=1 Tax=Phenylobacterium sp. TaxID=1871053 RepID=UPI0025EBF4AC|nr:Wzz/FepE/Etk N-terminal domain-containing protein [Phenylobacterium sp.]MBT9471368.1 exopolysaccharide biosynthesis protein EpsF [Phenylobacterium sp.]
MNIVQFLRILWARRWLVLAATISCVIGAFIVTQIVPPRYQAQSRVMLELVKPDPITGQITSPQFAKAYTRTQIELIKDYRVAGKVVEDLGWLNDPNLLAQYQSRPAGDDRDLKRWAAQRIIDGTDAKLIEGSNIMELTFSASSPELARSVADALREAYMDSSLAYRRENAARTAEWYSVQAEKAKASLAIAEAQKATFERENGVILQDDKTDIDSARLAALASAGAPTVAAAMPVGPTPAGIQLAQLDATIAQASRTLGPNHPDLQAMRQQRAMLATQAAQERSAAGAAAGAAASAARVGAGMLEAQKSKVIGQRDKLERVKALQAEVDVRRDQFMKASNRAADLRLEANVGETGITPLGNAVTPQKPVFPNMPLIMVGSLGFGLAFGVLIALLTELFGRRVRSIEDLSSAVDAPLLAVIATAAKPRRTLRSLASPGGRRGADIRTKAARA